MHEAEVGVSSREFAGWWRSETGDRVQECGVEVGETRSLNGALEGTTHCCVTRVFWLSLVRCGDVIDVLETWQGCKAAILGVCVLLSVFLISNLRHAASEGV
jgi:hypothetical protein